MNKYNISQDGEMWYIQQSDNESHFATFINLEDAEEYVEFLENNISLKCKIGEIISIDNDKYTITLSDNQIDIYLEYLEDDE